MIMVLSTDLFSSLYSKAEFSYPPLSLVKTIEKFLGGRAYVEAESVIQDNLDTIPDEVKKFQDDISGVIGSGFRHIPIVDGNQPDSYFWILRD